MPVHSQTRKTLLYTADEISERTNIPLRTVRRAISAARKRGTLYEESHKPQGRTGPPGKYADALTLGLSITPASLGLIVSSQVGTHSVESVPAIGANSSNLCQVPLQLSQTTETPLARLGSESQPMPEQLAQIPANVCQPDPLELARHDPALLLQEAQGAEYRDTDPEAARKLYAIIQPVLDLPRGSRDRGKVVRTIAQTRAVNESTVRDWVSRFERQGLSGLQPQMRRDRGAFRVSQEALQLICAAIVTNPVTTSTRKIYDTLLLAVPDMMLTRRAGNVQIISLATVTRIRDALLAHPQMRLMMMDADARKEFLRTYMGKVIAAHANDMWQQDMTRCDVLVYDEDTGLFYRPRVQAIIDVFSGCIPGLAFSPDEDQVQADLAFFRALVPTQGPLASRYPIYGRPRRIYIDNGKTYRSQHFERIARELGIEMVHSRPYVSHTRGAIERFFGTLHTFERTLPGYVGRDAADRGSEELERLSAATRRWVETGRDPGEGRRLMTLREYQNAVLRWLIVDYHQHVVNGRTRLEWFTSSAPAHSLVEFDLGELLIHFAQRVERVVRPDCTVQVDNVLWACPDGALGSYAGTRVVVMHDAMILGNDLRIIAIRERAGHLRILGKAVRAPENALSIDAGELRRVNKAAKREALEGADDLKTTIADPALLVRKQHERQLPVVPVTALPASTRAQITSVTPEPTPDLGDFGKSFLRADEPTDMDSFMRSLREDE